MNKLITFGFIILWICSHKPAIGQYDSLFYFKNLSDNEVKVNHIKSISEIFGNELKYKVFYNNEGQKIREIFYDKGKQVLCLEWKYDSFNQVVEKRESNLYSDYNVQTLLRKSINGQNITTTIKYLKSDSTHKHISIEERDVENKLLSNEFYDLIETSTVSKKIMGDSTSYEYYQNDTIKSKRSYFKNKILREEKQFNSKGLLVYHVLYSIDGKMESLEEKEYKNDTLLVSVFFSKPSQSLKIIDEHFYNKNNLLIKSQLFDSRIGKAITTYLAQYNKGDIVSEETFNKYGIALTKKVYTANELYKIVSTYESGKEDKLFKQQEEWYLPNQKLVKKSTYNSEGGLISEIDYEYDSDGHLIKEVYFINPNKEKIKTTTWKYEQGKLIEYNEFFEKDNFISKKNIYNNGLIIKSFSCRPMRDSLLCTTSTNKYNAKGERIGESSFLQDKLSSKYECVFDSNERLISFLTYGIKSGLLSINFIYNDKGLLTEKQFVKNGKVLQRSFFKYEFYLN